MRRRWGGKVVGVALAGCALSFSTSARAQLLRISPGPLAEAHKELDTTAGCFNCHSSKGSKNDVICMGCHQHAEIKAAVEAKTGLHGHLNAPCLQCHTEHKGRDYALADWSMLGGKNTFRHATTGFVLRGMHDKAACDKCHKKRTASGRISYTGVSTRCEECHRNPHELTSEKLKESCLLCHVVGGVPPKDMHDAALPFDHEKDTGIALVGHHRNVRCVKCHEKGRMSMAKQRSCHDCHKDRHGKTFAKWTCIDCHQPARKFKDVEFDHRDTDFRLGKGHLGLRCLKCHKNPRHAPSKICESCHKKSPHRDRFAELKCAQCHGNGDPVPSVFAHQKRTRFPLTAGHAELKCRKCHRGKRPFQFESVTDAIVEVAGKPEVDCLRCHQETHRGQFGKQACLSCHKANGSRELIFDHARDAKFELVGIHKQQACEKCHPQGRYRSGQRACEACHKDPHKGDLGTECTRCHSPSVKFKEIVFEHDELATFTLGPVHREVACEKCHPENRFKTGLGKCVDCHLKTDPHAGKLGLDCERCHTKEHGAPRFVHEKMTKFALSERHRLVPCTYCHRERPKEGPPKAGWTKAEAAGALDRKFPIMGSACVDCHQDPHAGRNGPACDGCHKGSAFAEVSATVHDTGAFRLEGIHATLRCERCHQPRRQLWGTGSLCQGCHRDDDAHNNGLGPSCGDCHTQLEWRPARFSHSQTGFPLRGVHRTVRCEGCHGLGTYGGLPQDCEVCHQRDAASVSDPLHTAELRPCDRCHFEAGFIPARQSHGAFELIGQHRFVRCASCHGGGVYAGTPRECASCHLTLFNDPRSVPNHLAAGYAPICEDCHRPTGWRPATQKP